MHYKSLLAVTVAAFAMTNPVQAQTFEIDWFSIDGGGELNSTGAIFSISGTIGQPDAGELSGGVYTLTGGFWGVIGTGATACPGERGDSNCDGVVDFFDIDAFLLSVFDPPTYQATFCSGTICAGDTDCSGTVDFFDIDPFLQCLFGACPPCP